MKKVFDLLCNVDGELQRLPFDEGKEKNPVAIYLAYPTTCYLEFNEVEIPRKNVDKEIPVLEFWRYVYQQKDDLNRLLKELNQPLIEGPYYASDMWEEFNLIVCFGDNDRKLNVNHCNPDQVAKYRYAGGEL